MMVGERHLQDAGYKSIWAEDDDKNKASKKDDEDGTQDDNKLAIEESKLAIEQQLAPWITTRNFLNATQVLVILYENVPYYPRKLIYYYYYYYYFTIL